MFDFFITHSFRKDLRKYKKSSNPAFPFDDFEQALLSLKKGQPLDPKFKDHDLSGNLKGYREFHLMYDLLVIYQVDKQQNLITLFRLGSHSQLF